MRVLLCYPDPARAGGTALIPKLGLGYLASALRNAGHDVQILDREQTTVTAASSARCLAERWDLVGFQVFSNGLRSMRRDLRILKAMQKDVVTLAGGPLASGLPEWLLEEHADLDYVLRGEAEESLVALLGALGERRSPQHVPGIVFRDHGKPRLGPSPKSPDLDRLPLPAWDLMPPSAYPPAPVGGVARAFPVGPVITSRGCPFRCPYCAARVIHGLVLRTRAPEAVLAEMEELALRWGVQEIQVLDDCFGYDRAQADALLAGIAQAPWRVPISFPNGLRLDQLDEDLVALIEAAGVYAVTFGIDFGSDRMLRKMNRRMTTADIRRRLSMVRAKTRLRLTGNFILGHFEDTREGMEETVRLARELPLDRAHFSAYVPIPGTPDWHRLSRSGRVKDLRLEEADFNSFSVEHPELTRRELANLKRRAYLLFYSRPDRLSRIVSDARRPASLLHLFRKAVYHA